MRKNIKFGVARAGNVIGGGDWAKDRIIVDCVKAFSKGETVEIRSPNATRPWQHVLEPLSGYLSLAQNLFEAFDVFRALQNHGNLSKIIAFDHRYPKDAPHPVGTQHLSTLLQAIKQNADSKKINFLIIVNYK